MESVPPLINDASVSPGRVELLRKRKPLRTLGRKCEVRRLET